MKGKFKDHFSDASNDYKLYRPLYPAELYSYLASISPGNQTAWDCATGSGQSAAKLAGHFSRVIATDSSTAQIDSAVTLEGVTYRVASAEHSGIDARSIDLITVAQALHWFDIQAFALEAGRVLKPEGILAVWTYNLLEVELEVDRHIAFLYASILENYWPEERSMVKNGYADVNFSFDELISPAFKMTASWNLSQLLGYLRTWSAFKRYREDHQADVIEAIEAGLSEAWGDENLVRIVRWPLSLRTWKNSGLRYRE